VTTAWKRSNSACASARDFPFTACVMSDALAFEIAHPSPTKRTSASVSPVERDPHVSASPHSVCAVRRPVEPRRLPQVAGLRLWSRMTGLVELGEVGHGQR
jgi:hypothetical protein